MGEVLNKIGYKSKICYDLDRREILTTVHDISIEDHDKHDSFVLYFSGHGGSGVHGEGTIYGDCQNPGSRDEVQIIDLVDYFQPQKCPTLGNKPKIFFWDCCRGNKDFRSKGIGVKHYSGSSSHSAFLPPRHSNFLYGYSSAPDYKSYAATTAHQIEDGQPEKSENVTKGLSVWTYCLIDNILRNAAGRRHLTDVLTKVQRDVPKVLEEN
eukprot:TRINITY_DN2454_c0_g1_i1.p1 TRINITY_DN2454_c0_g1~~TRINITY_DN2454_c0_g1_i1.p1  ORF type:complete len:210 (-),score=31.80 TRINITY_DN2454_c0_g1_i1:137-766(-)